MAWIMEKLAGAAYGWGQRQRCGSHTVSMKRLSDRQRRWQVRHARFSNIRRMYSNQKAWEGRTGRRTDTRREARNPKVVNIMAPAVLSLETNANEVGAFLNRIVEEIGKPGLHIQINFEPIREIGLGAALALAATLDMWQRIRGIRLRPVREGDWLPSVRQSLVEIGMFDLLQTKNPPISDGVAGHRVKMLRFCSGENADGSLARELTSAMNELAGPYGASQFLYGGLTEAMTNVAQHAYADESMVGIPSSFCRWWMAGSYDEERRCMRVVILDMGVGIPATLPRSGNWEMIKGILAKLTVNDDADVIAAAVEAGRTSTGVPGRGNGLRDIRLFVENSVSGRLRILSGRGEVIYEKGSETPRKRTVDDSVIGTLIEWEVFGVVSDEVASHDQA